MPELAAMFLLGLLAELLLVALFAFLLERRRTSGPFAILRANLAKAGLFWSEHTEKIRAGTPRDELRDGKRSLQTILLTGGLLAGLSWLGVLFFAILMLSHRYLARSRLERELFASRLAREPDLTGDEVREILAPYLTSAPPSPAQDDRPPEPAGSARESRASADRD